jgi:hypothetical protein
MLDLAIFSRIPWTISAFSALRTHFLLYSSRTRFFTSEASTGMPGPMVVDR